jgi:chloramphenicol 3-O-phosphotransferase
VSFGHHERVTAPGQVVVLNGTSSAGESSTATAFQAARAAVALDGLDPVWVAVRCDVELDTTVAPVDEVVRRLNNALRARVASS